MWPFSPSFDPESEMPNLRGKTVLVTGGSSGLGRESVRQFAKHGAKVILAARNESRSMDVITSIRESIQGADITFLQLDLASFASVAAAAKTVVSEHDRLDILMNNGGIMAVPPGLTQDGFEIQFGTNHMGHALLTKILLPLLLHTAELSANSDVRVINLTSIAQQHLAPSAGFLPLESTTTMENRGAWERYGHSKLANVLFAKALAKHCPTITSVAVHPGGVQTGLGDVVKDNSSLIVKGFLKVVEALAMVDVSKGARGQLWAAVGKRAVADNEPGGVKSGAVYYPTRNEHLGRSLINDPANADALWEWTEAEIEARRALWQ